VADGLGVVDQQKTAFLFMLVSRRPGLSPKAFRVFLPRSQGRKEGPPVLVQLLEYQLTDLTRQSSIGFCVFRQMVELSEGNVTTPKQSGLPNGVVAQVVEILGRKGSRIDRLKTWVICFDHVLFNQDYHDIPSTSTFPSESGLHNNYSTHVLFY